MTDDAGDEAGLWPTATALDHRSIHAGQETMARNARPLSEFVGSWATPRSSDGEKGGPNQKFSAGGVPLVAQAAQWATPSVAVATGGQLMRGNDRGEELLLTGQAVETSTLMARSLAPYAERNIWPTPTALSRPRNEASLDKVGAIRLENAGQNTVPLYLEEVAIASGLPAPATSTGGAAISRSGLTLNPRFVEALMGWPTGWSSFACSETALSLWKRRMRCALSDLGSPPEAAPAQLSLFG